MQHTPIPLAETKVSDATGFSRFRVIVPAHNEEAVIGRCLAAITTGRAANSEMDVVVVANGCTDRTAAIAKSFGYPVRVIETEVPSKAHAINLGLEGLGHQPCLIADADIDCRYDTLKATAEILTLPGVSAASPQLEIDARSSSFLVRAYYKVWSALPYARDRLIGGGVYGLSAEAAESLGAFPDVIADDLYVRSQFDFAERRTVRSDQRGNQVYITMYPPRFVRDLVAIEARRWRGNRELRLKLGPDKQVAGNGLGSLMAELGKSYSTLELLSFAGVKIAGRLLALLQLSFGDRTWTRDMSSRVSQ